MRKKLPMLEQQGHWVWILVLIVLELLACHIWAMAHRLVSMALQPVDVL